MTPLTEEQKKKRIENFIRIGKIEGYSYLLLLFVAMPLKKWMGLPEAVRIVGMLHGILFIAFMYQTLQMMLEKLFNFKRAAYAVLLSLVPFGTFYLRRLTDPIEKA